MIAYLIVICNFEFPIFQKIKIPNFLSLRNGWKKDFATRRKVACFLNWYKIGTNRVEKRFNVVWLLIKSSFSSFSRFLKKQAKGLPFVYKIIEIILLINF